MLDYKRSDRLGDLIQREISDILQRRIRDPRIGFCTIMRVDVSDDLRYAKVRVSIMGSDSQKKSALAGLKSARGFIRREVGHRITLRHTPEISFVLDSSIEDSMRIAQLIDEGEKEIQFIDEDEKEDQLIDEGEKEDMI